MSPTDSSNPYIHCRPGELVARGKSQLLWEQAKIRAGLYANVLIAPFVAWILWNVVPAHLLSAWLGAVGIVTITRSVVLLVERRLVRFDDKRGAWLLHLCGVTSNALVWGIAGYSFAPYCTIDYQIALAFVLAGMAVGAIPSLAARFEAYLLYLVVLLLPVSTWFYFQWTHIHIAMGLVVTVLAVALVGIAHNYSRNYNKARSLTTRNDELTDGLNEINSKLQTTNQDLQAQIGVRREAEHQLIHNSRQLYESESRFRDFAQLGADLFWEVDTQSQFTFVSDSFSEVMGLDYADVYGKRFEHIVRARFEDEQDLLEFTSHIKLCETIADFRFAWKKPNGETIVLLTSGKPAYDQNGVLRGFRCAAEDITESHLLAERLSYQATHDELTKLINRREFERRLQGAIDQTRRKDIEHAFCYIDLDQFKVVNDTCGHAAGDELLRQLVGLLQSNVRNRDTVARLGGDEFGVLLENCSAAESYRVAEMLRRSLEAFKFSWRDTSFQVSCSIGVVPITPDSAAMASVMGHADAACYAAKDEGRNRVHVYDPGDIELERRHGEMQWVNRISKALEDDRFRLCAQPIWPVGEDISHDSFGALAVPKAGLHFEILVRMQSEDGHFIGPDAFLPAAERYNLSPKLDRWVIKTTFDWLAQAPPQIGSCSINVSGNSLGDANFSQFVVSELQRRNLSAEQICFEVTETAAITNLTAATQFIDAVRSLGCRLSLDDFGSGLSSFGYLKKLQVDYLKIDGVFVKDIAKDPVDYAMVKSINELGHVLGIQTIAEFVEDESVMERVREIGVDYAQGYFVGKPVLLEDLMPSRDVYID